MLQLPQHPILRRILLIPPTPTVFDQLVIDVSAIGHAHIREGASVIVLAVGLDDDILPEDERRHRMLRSVTEGLAFFRTIDAAQADAFRAGVVQDCEGIALEDGNDGAREVSRVYDYRGECENGESQRDNTQRIHLELGSSASLTKGSMAVNRPLLLISRRNSNWLRLSVTSTAERFSKLSFDHCSRETFTL